MALKAKAEEEAEAAKVSLEPWVNEPETVEQLLHQYIIEGKFAGRVPGTTLFLVQSKNRDGACHQVIENQKFKLFLVPRLDKNGNKLLLITHPHRKSEINRQSGINTTADITLTFRKYLGMWRTHLLYSICCQLRWPTCQ